MPFKKGYIPWNKNKHYSEERKRKMSEVSKKNPIRYWLGKKRPSLNEEQKRKLSEIHKRIGSGKWMKGKHHSITTRKKMSERQKGEKGSNWKGGISLQNERIRNGIDFHLWRESVFARDNWTCQKCRTRSGNRKIVYLHPHHIKNFAEYPELRFAIDNGITFCKKCHEEFHKIYGRKNNTKEQLKEFLIQNKIKI